MHESPWLNLTLYPAEIDYERAGRSAHVAPDRYLRPGE